MLEFEEDRSACEWLPLFPAPCLSLSARATPGEAITNGALLRRLADIALCVPLLLKNNKPPRDISQNIERMDIFLIWSQKLRKTVASCGFNYFICWISSAATASLHLLKRDPQVDDVVEDDVRNPLLYCDWRIMSVDDGPVLEPHEHTWRICTRRAGKLYKALNFASKYAFESSRRDLYSALFCTVLKSLFSQKLLECFQQIAKFWKTIAHFAHF